MGTSKTTIELNGKKYDARTGRIISDESSEIPQHTAPTKAQKINNQVLDGFVRRPQSSTSSTQSHSQAKKPVQKAPRTTVNHVKRPVSKSKTLMRPAVKKPSQIKNDIQKQKYVTKPNHTSAVRLSRATSTEKSPMISRFGKVGLGSTVKKSTATIPLATPPKHHHASISKTANNELDKFEQAIKNASSHLHQLEKDVVKKVPFLSRVGFKNRFANIATMATAFLLLVGFFGYQNSAQISMRVASQQAGINAKMPGYVPAGYDSQRTASSGDGRVSLGFRSTTDSKGFTLVQQASNWNSTSLLANHVQRENCQTCYQTWQEDGKTIYIYNDTNATWVDGGIWYKVEGNAILTSDQLLRIAKSL